MLDILRDTLKVLAQRSVWVLIIPALILLAVSDIALVKTLVQWSAFALVLAGVSIVISMITFPQIKLTDFVAEAKRGSMPAAVVSAAIILFFGLLFFSMVFWSKA